MNFGDENILDELALADAEQLDALPFGVVRMDLHGVVVNYNRSESELSGLPPARVIGREFFEQVAPCTNNFLVAERFKEDSVDDQIDYVFTFKMKPTKVRPQASQVSIG